tara:strand:+ start:1322 stop:2137 length:816 start_codon:yes stop_codon:yes gene_type:complete
MEESRPFLALPIGGNWNDTGARIPSRRVVSEDDFNTTWNTFIQGYYENKTTAVDAYVVIHMFDKKRIDGNLELSEDAVVEVLKALQEYTNKNKKRDNDSDSDNAWSVWGGPPDDDSLWVNLWKKRDEWEDKRDVYVSEHRRDYSRAYKAMHIKNMNDIFGEYDFRSAEETDARLVGDHTRVLVHRLLNDNHVKQAINNRAPPYSVSFELLNDDADFWMDQENYDKYRAQSTLLSELQVRKRHIWKHYDVPRNSHSDMLLLWRRGIEQVSLD